MHVRITKNQSITTSLTKKGTGAPTTCGTERRIGDKSKANTYCLKIYLATIYTRHIINVVTTNTHTHINEHEIHK